MDFVEEKNLFYPVRHIGSIVTVNIDLSVYLKYLLR